MMFLSFYGQKKPSDVTSNMICSKFYQSVKLQRILFESPNVLVGGWLTGDF